MIVGIGGSTRSGSTSERALCFALKAAEAAGARTVMFGGAFLGRLPIYAPEMAERSTEQREFIEAVRAADGIIVSTPGYHGGVSGMVKNALDLLEDLREDKRAYLESRAVGCIVTAFGWQTCGTTLSALRSIVHALRGWPTPARRRAERKRGHFRCGRELHRLEIGQPAFHCGAPGSGVRPALFRRIGLSAVFHSYSPSVIDEIARGSLAFADRDFAIVRAT